MAAATSSPRARYQVALGDSSPRRSKAVCKTQMCPSMPQRMMLCTSGCFCSCCWISGTAQGREISYILEHRLHSVMSPKFSTAASHGMAMSLPNIVNSVLATGTEDAGRHSLISSTVLPKREGYCSVTMTGMSKAAAPLTCHGCQRINHARSHIDQYRELKYV